MGPVELPAWLQPRYRKNAYLFIYYLIQFCGHSWIFTNMTVRFFSFGKDSVVDTFYAIGLVMRLCQSVSLLELLHIYVGIESDHLLPRLLQLTERIIILFVVITSQEEVQEKYVVCVLFIFWNLLDMVRNVFLVLSVMGISKIMETYHGIKNKSLHQVPSRRLGLHQFGINLAAVANERRSLQLLWYTYSMLSVIGISYAVLTWLSQTLWMPIYPLCVLAEGMYFTYSHLYSERRDILRVFPIKKKKM
ncbi:very-long-chain (3R)-3-hydroxyacyl-CoA dehydratase 4 isoform X2 [Eschrichtius robustus]|uniref:very-long-chain (3R)-3-hydroxyacyl-CoA dehydratase 4 isoform X2 n=1 Tax=Eschrichtius robustus TaxID=9764 RepID=UPI0035C068A0